jgi:hypothetical protein
MCGGKLVKVYLGNILNIDIETPMFYPSMHFAHHVIEKIDKIWVSPHYGQHAEYAAYLNHVIPPKKLEDMIAPYVWDPAVFTRDGEELLRWRPRTKEEEDVILIMEPNISFQKTSLIPLLIVERWYRAGGRRWKGKVVVFNGSRMKDTPHFSKTIEPTLDLFMDGRIEYMDRTSITVALKKWPTALFVAHQYNNEYNYMTLELLNNEYPVLHNSESWKEYGYYYKGSGLDSACEQIKKTYDHENNLETYKAHAKTLIWTHSPYNPSVQEKWSKIL